LIIIVVEYMDLTLKSKFVIKKKKKHIVIINVYLYFRRGVMSPVVRPGLVKSG
jgi:hypothetical protein